MGEIDYQSHEENLAATLIDLYKSRPVTFAAKERVRKARQELESNKQLQTDLGG